jgi:hypothetical protein
MTGSPPGQQGRIVLLYSESYESAPLEPKGTLFLR